MNLLGSDGRVQSTYSELYLSNVTPFLTVVHSVMEAGEHSLTAYVSKSA